MPDNQSTSEEIKTAKNNRKAKKAALTRLMNQNRACRDIRDSQGVQDALPGLEVAFNRLVEAHEEYSALLDEEEPLSKADEYLYDVKANYNDFIDCAKGWLNLVNQSEQDVRIPEQQRSQLEQDQVGKERELLDIEAKRLDHESEIQQQELELQRLQLELDISKRKADLSRRTEAFKRALGADMQEAGAYTHSTPKPTHLPSPTKPTGTRPFPLLPEAPTHTNNMPNRESTTPVNANNTLPNEVSAFHQYAEYSRLQYQSCMDTMRLPPADMPTFDGDPLKYWQFERQFTSLVNKETVSSGDKLNRLIQFTSGKARNAVSHFVYEPDAEYGFTQAWERLRTRFGNNHHVSEAWIQKITRRPNLTSNQQLQEMADDLRGCLETLTAMNCLEELGSSRCLLDIVKKLPRDLQQRWVSENYRITQAGRLPKLKDVVTFVEGEAAKRADPVFGSLVGGTDQKSPASKPPNAKRSNFSVKANETVQERPQGAIQKAAPQQNRGPSSQCPKCSEGHYLNQCSAFRSMSVQDRLKFVQGENRCVNCFAAGHRGKDCSRPWVCNVEGCGKKHNRWLHLPNNPKKSAEHGTTRSNGDTSQSPNTNSNNVTCAFAGARTGKVSLPIVPVIVKGLGNTRFTKTHALLDSGSTHSWCSEELADKLGVHKTEGVIELTTIDKKQVVENIVRVNLEVEDLSRQHAYSMYEVITRPHLNVGLDNFVTSDQLSRWKHLKDITLSDVDVTDVQLLIGMDVPDVMIPEEVIRGGKGEPYAVRTSLGWTINGPVDSYAGISKVHSHFLKADIDLQSQVEKFWQLEELSSPADTVMSVSDQRVVSFWEESICRDGHHYSLGIPFKSRPPYLPDSRHMAEHRLQLLAKRLAKNADLKMKYVAGIRDSLDKGYAEPVPPDELGRDDGYVWFLPHHPVVHPRKPEKVRPVFDCAAKVRGISLNDQVYQGPDLTNNLIGVLLRFREERVAIIADIEGMFYQVRVHAMDRDALRFLWWEDDDITKQPIVYRMTSHLFGGVWSPSCASFALKRTALDNANQFDPETINTVKNNFYVDDCLKSVATEDGAIRLVQQLRDILSLGGFHLTKWLSNSRSVMKSVPKDVRAKNVATLDLDREILPAERTLGILWKVETDEFSFDVHVRNKPNTKRGLLSVASSVYDPLGFASPFVLNAKKLFQMLCRRKKGWDEQMPEELLEQWNRWLDDIPKIARLKIPRCLKPTTNLDTPTTCQLHHFSDASEQGYGAVSFIRFVDRGGRVHCSLVMAKAKLAPLKVTTIPRLELTAAVVSVKLDKCIREHLNFTLLESIYWTDSMIVLQYLYNQDKRFQTFVANRIARIHEHSLPTQWRHVDSASNPADDVSRGMTAQELVDSSRWINGPPFLWMEEGAWPVQPTLMDLPLHPDAEVKKETAVYHTTATNCMTVFDELFAKHSSWYGLKRAVAWVHRAIAILRRGKAKLGGGNSAVGSLTMSELRGAEAAIIAYTQTSSLSPDQRQQAPLSKLSPSEDSNRVLRVGGRLSNATISYEAKHPAILPTNHRITDLIIEHYHIRLGHAGAERILAEIRQRFWILKGRVAVKRVLRKCMGCRRRKALPQPQMMADLPKDRVTPGEPPFTHVGVDFFGPFIVRRARTDHKRYGCLFTCLTTRAIHLEVCHSLETTSFINALQRFIARRGPPAEIRSDNGTNFVGGKRELKEAIEGWNQSKIENHLLQHEVSWIFNPPAASHMGGVWERQIRTIRSVLITLLSQQTLDDEGLVTMMCVVESIINGRPITKLTDDPADPLPLTPNHLLLLRSGPFLPPGMFVKPDLYRRRWRQVQYMADVFWKRWLKEYLPALQARQKWLKPVRNLQPGDLVLIMHENSPRGRWPLGLVTKAFPGKDNLVRSVEVKTQSGIYTRPVDKLCLLEAQLI